ncbi:inorganic phosphate transporter [Lapillicoccus sp.]|uniref:inorganic phosphate transporter n=1 Tax=Lapillicoccus sp. TaxID=1909287 RepID=UPI003263EAFD
MNNDLVLVLVVVTALAFDFTNGFHDTGNAMATSIATGALPPKVAVGLSGVLNLVGAFLSFSVAATIASGLVSKVLLPAVLSPLIAGVVAAIGTYLVYRITRGIDSRTRDRGFRLGQIGSASMVSPAHGTNDAQKTMGIITLALIANGSLATGVKAPTSVIVSCAVAISAGTYFGGWRVIRTLGKGLVEIDPPQGLTAETASGAIILVSSYFGYALSTTHVATGSILGSGVGKSGAEVRWHVARRMVLAWLLTLPAAGVVGAYAVTIALGESVGVIVLFVCLLAGSAAVFAAARRDAVTAANVNADWTGRGTRNTSHAPRPVQPSEPSQTGSGG